MLKTSSKFLRNLGGKKLVGTLLGFYISAQMIERITEVLSWLPVWGDPEDKNTRTKRILFLSTALGVAFCLWVRLGFFSAAGLEGINPLLDRILSGIVVGAGSKPVHDIISSIDKYRTAKLREIRGR